MVKKTKGVSARRVLLKYTHYLAEAGALSKISLLITLHFFFLSTFQLTIFQFKVITDGGTTYYSSEGQQSHRSVFLERTLVTPISCCNSTLWHGLKLYVQQRMRKFNVTVFVEVI